MPTQQHLILAGDIGGTKTNLALFGVAGNSLSILREQRFPSTGYPGLNAMIREFLGHDAPPVLAAGFGVPGVVNDGRAKPTNLTWGVDAAEIAGEAADILFHLQVALAHHGVSWRSVQQVLAWWQERRPFS